MLGVYRTGNRHVGCVSYWGPPCWVRMEPEVTTLIVPEAAMVGVSHRKLPCWVCITPGAAMLDVYRTGSRRIGCVSYWEPPYWVRIVPEAAILGVYCAGSRHVVRSIHLKLINCGRRRHIFQVCLAPGAAMLSVYRTGSRHVGCVSCREPPCWVCTAQGAAMLYAPFI